MTLSITSPVFADGARIPQQHTCEGDDLSPPLAWSDAPPATRSFVLFCDDPDAPRGTWHHWAAFDIAAERAELAEAQPTKPQVGGMRQAVNDFGRFGYGGPCPPPGHGVHHYHFQLLALDVDTLAAKDSPTCADVAMAAETHVIARATLVGTYSR